MSCTFYCSPDRLYPLTPLVFSDIVYLSLARAENALVTVDHPAVPLRLLEGPMPNNVLASA